MNFRSILEDNPIIAAVKDANELKLALESNSAVIFVLFGDLLNIRGISKSIKENGKIGIVHIDLIDGLSHKDAAIRFIKEETEFEGVISTRSQSIRSAKNQGLIAIQRTFIIDTISLENATKIVNSDVDAVEILPGIIPKVIEKLDSIARTPIIAGGLVEEKEEVMLALRSGATSVSSTKSEIWDM